MLAAFVSCWCCLLLLCGGVRGARGRRRRDGTTAAAACARERVALQRASTRRCTNNKPNNASRLIEMYDKAPKEFKEACECLDYYS